MLKTRLQEVKVKLSGLSTFTLNTEIDCARLLFPHFLNQKNISKLNVHRYNMDKNIFCESTAN